MLQLKKRRRISFKALNKFHLIAIAGVLVLTAVQPSSVMAIFNIINPPKIGRQNVAPLKSVEAPETTPLISSESASLEGINTKYKEKDYTASDRKSEVVEERTSNTSTYVNKDGTHALTYSTRQQNYLNGKTWERVDNTLKEQTSLFGREISGRAGNAEVTFGPLQDGITIEVEGKSLNLKPEGASTLSQPEKVDPVTVRYPEAWPGIDIEYELRGEAIKETIIIKNKNAQTSFDYSLTGDRVVEHPTIEGALAFEGISDDYYISPVTLDVNGRGVISESHATQTPTESGIHIALDEEWVTGQSEDAFPIRVDPTFTRQSSITYKMYKSDGYYCNSSVCYANTGSINDSGWKSWRTYISFDYSVLDNKTVLAANVQGLYKTGVGGTTASKTLYLGHASCSNGFNCYGTTADSKSVTDNFSMDFVSALQGVVDSNDFSEWWSFKGQEGSSLSYKPYYDMQVTVIYDTPTPAATFSSPNNEAVITTTQPSLSVNAVTDADGDNEQYYFRVATGSDAETGAVINSGWISAPQWTVPENILQDGTTYYWHVYTRGNTSVPNTSPTSERSFRVDLRTGMDSTQTYESVGPVDVNLATGNLTTSVGSHSIGALGGDIGLNLNYNSPAMTQPGLTAEYWNDWNRTTPPVMTRTDADINFNWGSGTPASGVINDNGTSVRWSGYITSPETQDYYFGCEVDDMCWIYLNGSGYFSRTTPGTAFSSSTFHMEAGVAYPITVDQVEDTSGSKMKLLVKGPIAQQPVPASWFSTAPRAVSNEYGLEGRYYNDPSASYTLPTNLDDPSRLLMIRNDRRVSFNWGTKAVSAGMPTNNFLARWKGYITVPETSSYTMGFAGDDGVRIKLGTGSGGSDQTVLDKWTSISGNEWGTAKTLTAGQKVSITVEYTEHTGNASAKLLIKGTSLAEQEVPVTWLTPDANPLPEGWEMAVGTGGARFEKIKIKSESAVLSNSTGQKYEFKYSDAKASYKPPTGLKAILVRNDDNTHNLTDVDGSTYIFDVDGSLKSWVAAPDDKQPASLQYEYSGNPKRLTKITDGVDANRYANVYYSGDSHCVTGSGFDAAPSGMLCAFATTDGKTTYFQYKNGALARVASPGDAYQDYGYDSMGRIIQYRDVLANDAIAYSVRSDNSEARTEITYDSLGRVASVKSPAPTPSATRHETTFGYYSGMSGTHVTGASEPYGFTKKIEYDSLYRTTKFIDNAGLQTTNQWDANKDIVLSTTDPLGLKTTTLYDDDDVPTDTYGPAPSSWFGSDRKPTSTYVNQVPHVETKYDEDMTGLGVSYFDNKKMLYTPKLNDTKIWTSSQNVKDSFTSSSPPVSNTSGWSARYLGSIRLSATGNYTFKIKGDAGFRLFIDDTLIVDGWGDGNETYTDRTVTGSTFNNSTANSTHRLRIEQYHSNSVATNMELKMIAPGSSETGQIATLLSPNYHLTTSTTAYDSVAGDVKTKTEYSDPTYGLVDKTTADPTGLNLQNDASYETPGSGYLRQTSRTSPGGSEYTYLYYGASEAVDNPCTVTSDAVSQAGRAKGKVEPDPDGAGSQTARTTQTIYNASGDIVATRYNSDSWTCLTYDTRGRQTESVQPSINGRPGRTIVDNYVVSGNPLKQQRVDSVVGTKESQVDLLGRTVSSQDVWGNAYATTYDNFGNVIGKTSPVGTEAYSYDSFYRPANYWLDDVLLAYTTYDSYGRINHVVYPEAKDSSNNTLELTQVKHDSLQRFNGATFETSDGEEFDETTVLSQLGKVMDATQTYDSQTLESEFDYDGVGRLTSAMVGETEFEYGYGAPDGATCDSNSANNDNSNKNSNRTSYTVTNTTTSAVVTNDELCYDSADKLTYSTDDSIGAPTYDDHGNTTSFSGDGTSLELEYNASDYNIAIEQGTKRTEYVKADDGSVLRKKEFDSNNLTTSYRYVAGGSIIQTCSLTDDADCTTLDTYISLPGNVGLTLSPSRSDLDKKVVYSLKNYHGDTALTLTGEGKPSSTNDTLLGYGAFGEELIAGTLGASSDTNLNATDSTQGWAAHPTRKQDGRYTTALVQMGARVYIPSLGRFLQVDPVEGGTLNAYIYTHDPVNSNDYSGRFIWFAIAAVVVALVVITANNKNPHTSAPSKVPKTENNQKSTNATSTRPHGLLIDRVENDTENRRVKVYPSTFGRVQAIISKTPAANPALREHAWAEVVGMQPSANTPAMKDQFMCHWDIVAVVFRNKESWNLDLDSPDVGYFATVREECNP